MRIVNPLDRPGEIRQGEGMKVVLAEKPSVAREIASVLGADRRQKGYLEGNGWAVTWALGHLVELQEPHEYQPEWRQWRVETLPMLPARFGLRPRGDQGAQDQLRAVKALFDRAELLVCATDAGREGELIFRYIQQWAGAVAKPFKRLWLQSLTSAAIRAGVEKLRDGHEFDHLFEAARCRSEADWLIGLNATRFTTAKYGSRNQLWSVGRVQTPVLALLAERDLEIERFVPEPYWVLITTYRETRFHQPKKRYKRAEDAEAVRAKVDGAPLTVTEVQQKEKRVVQPQLYDLSSLQQDMNTWFGFTADQTLQAAQELYESQKLTYPRTDSRHIGSEEAKGLPALLRSLPEEYREFVDKLDLDRLKPGKRVVDDAKVTDHHAILPTGTNPGGLSGMQAKVYAAVVRRLLAALYPVCRESVTTVKAESEGEKFQARGTVVIDPGWRELYPHLMKKRQPKPDEEDADQQMPEMVKGESGAHEPAVLEKKTKPPKRFTEASLLKRMETAGRLVDDEELREAMKQRGLGTPATRAAIIETLIGRGYVRRSKKQLISTETGRHLLTLVQDPALKSAELTGDWEAKLKDIEAGRGDPAAFMEGIRQHARDLVKDDGEREAAGGYGKCPKCGAPVIEGKKGFGCSAWKTGCDFVLWKELDGLCLDAGRVRELLDIGHTLHPVPVKDGQGNPGLAVLELSAEGTLIPKPVKGRKAGKNEKSLGTCPECGGQVVVKDKLYVCSNQVNGCPLRIWKTIAKRNITQAMVKQLLTDGRTDRIEDFTSRAGKPFAAVLVLKQGQVEMEFG